MGSKESLFIQPMKISGKKRLESYQKTFFITWTPQFQETLDGSLIKQESELTKIIMADSKYNIFNLLNLIYLFKYWEQGTRLIGTQSSTNLAWKSKIHRDWGTIIKMNNSAIQSRKYILTLFC